MRIHAKPALLVVLPLTAAAGCATMIDSAVDRAASRTGEGIGDAVGKKTGEMAGAYVAAQFPATWTADLTNIYVTYIFGLAFHSGSYTVAAKDYAAGEWTRWQMALSSGETKPDQLERAYLVKDKDGKDWWRVKLTDGESGDVMTLEGLFTADGTEMVRLRGKMPKETEAKEMPVQKGTLGYVKPTQLTEESLKGATVGTETVKVPAGSYQARHIRYGDAAGGTLDWWLTDKIPGGMAKYSRTEATGAQGEGKTPRSWALELLGSGSGAKSELGSF